MMKKTGCRKSRWTVPLNLFTGTAGRPVRQTYRRANTSINLGGVVDSADIFRSCSNILDKFGSKPTRDNLAVVNGSARSPAASNGSSASLKEFLLGRSKEPAPYPPDLPLKVSHRPTNQT